MRKIVRIHVQLMNGWMSAKWMGEWILNEWMNVWKNEDRQAELVNE